MSSRTVGLIGVGLVGMALVDRLHGAGWTVVGFDIDPNRRKELASRMGSVASSAAEVVASTDLIIISLPTSTIASQVIHALAVPLFSKTFIDTTTGEPSEMVAIGQYLAEHGAQYLDATIAGSSAQVREGDVVVMVGGNADVIARCDELLRAFSRHLFHLGDWGTGARMKLIVNLVLGLNRAVLAEGLSFARSLGIDPKVALDVLSAGPAFSQVMVSKGQKMLNCDFSPQARLMQHAKDVHLILEAGRQAKALLPFSTVHERLLDALLTAGYGDLDNSAIIKAFEEAGSSGHHESADATTIWP